MVGKPEFGVFLPVANGGWIISDAVPSLDGLWKQNLAAAVAADAIGLDFVMSMGKWRGFGGETNHWGVQLESVTMMAAIAQATSRVKLWATIHPMLQNPAVAAKLIATLDHISGGRAGLNIVAGAFRAEFEQMGAWDDALSHDDRYSLAEEWTHVLKRLWSEPSVTHQGRFFQMDDCRSEPKPLSQPRPDLISAGMSDRGFEFAVREADACFIGGRTADERRSYSRRAKAIAAMHGKSIRTYAMCTLVFAETDAKAEALAERYRAGVDMGAVIEMLRNWGVPPDRLTEAAHQQGAFMTETAIGSPATCADKIADVLGHCELDGLMLIFPDYEEGLAMFGADILPPVPEGDRVSDSFTDWIAPSRSALVVVDMQVDFASADGVLGRAGIRLDGGAAALAAAERLVEAARAADVTIVFVGTRTSPEMDSPAWAEWIRRRGGDPALEMSVCREGTVGADFVGPKPEPGELVISKQRYSGFFRTDLDDLLRAKRRDTVIVCGVTTDCCVDATARDAFNLDYQVIVPRDACAAYEADLHANALRSLELNCAVLADSAEVLAAWGAAAL